MIASLVVAAVMGGTVSGRAADDSVTVSRSRLAELERKAAEADRLADELAKAKAEIARLKSQQAELSNPKADNAKLKEEQAGLKKAASKPDHWLPLAVENATRNLPPTPPIDSLPPLQRDEVVPIHDLLNHYASDPVAADRRYRGRVFKVRGVIAELDKPLLISPYRVVFRLPGLALKVVCEVRPPEDYSKVYITNDRERIVGETERRRVTFATIGTEATYRGQCRGLRGGLVDLVGCVRQDTR